MTSTKGYFIFLTILLHCWCSSVVLSQDSSSYTVRVAPFMHLSAMGADRFETHPMTGANVTFSNQLWFARTSSGTGSTVRFSTDHAFHHVSSPSFKRDARLRLTRISGTASARWRFDSFDDQTNYAAGDETATVQVSCQSPGNAVIFMNVYFVTGNLATLQGGQYEMTVVGTISEN